MVSSPILIDPQIRNWVLFPIFIITLLVGLARHYVQQLIKSNNTSKIKKIKPLQILTRSQRFRQNSRFLPPFAFSSRKAYLQTKKVGLLCQKQERAENPMMSGNPSFQMDMMKGQMTNMLPSILMMTFVSYFFSGYVISKVPFPLTTLSGTVFTLVFTTRNVSCTRRGERRHLHPPFQRTQEGRSNEWQYREGRIHDFMRGVSGRV